MIEETRISSMGAPARRARRRSRARSAVGALLLLASAQSGWAYGPLDPKPRETVGGACTMQRIVGWCTLHSRKGPCEVKFCQTCNGPFVAPVPHAPPKGTWGAPFHC